MKIISSINTQLRYLGWKFGIYLEILFVFLRIFFVLIELLIVTSGYSYFISLQNSFYYNIILAHSESINLYYNLTATIPSRITMPEACAK